MATQQDIGFGVIGAGGIAGSHTQAIKDATGAQLIGIADMEPQFAVGLAGKHNVTAYGSVADLLADDTVQVVNICTPPAPTPIWVSKSQRPASTLFARSRWT